MAGKSSYGPAELNTVEARLGTKMAKSLVPVCYPVGKDGLKDYGKVVFSLGDPFPFVPVEIAWSE